LYVPVRRDDDTVLFDDIWNSIVACFRVMLRDQWMQAMWYVQDGVYPIMWVPFFALFFVATFALVNLFPGAMMASLQTTVREEENERKREADQAGNEEDPAAVRTDFELLLESFEEAYQEDLKAVNDFLSGKEHTAALAEENEPNLPPYTPTFLPFCKDLRHWVSAPFGVFAQFIYLVIFLVVLVLALDGYDADPEMKRVLAALNLTFVLIFVAEFVLKICVLGPIGYFNDKFNILDFVLVLFSILDLVVASVLSGTKALRVVRVFRLARVARIASLSKVVKLSNPTPSIDLIRMVEILSDSGYFIANVFFLLLFFNFIFTLVGLQLFGGNPIFDGELERFNFNSFNNAFMAVFSMTTGATGFTIFKQVAYTMQTNTVFVFYLAWQILAKYFLLATVAATLFQRIESDALNYMKKMARTTMQACYLFDRSVMRAWRAIAFRKWRDMSYRASGRMVTGALVNVKEDASANLADSVGLVKGLIESPKSYGVFAPQSAVRIICRDLSESALFEAFILIVVLVRCVCICFFAEEESGGTVHSTSTMATVNALNTFTALTFFFEFAVRSVYLGLWVAPDAYLRSHMNRINAIATISAVAAVIQSAAGQDSKAAELLSILRVIPMLQPVRLLNKVKPLWRAQVALNESAGAMMNVLLVTIGAWVLFALIGMQFFGGYFSACSDPSFPEGAHRDANITTATLSFPEGCSGSYYDTKTGELVSREWRPAFFNFDNFPNALYCMLTIFSLDGWERIYFSAVDGWDPDANPIVNSNKAYAAFFIILIMISYVTIQMIVGAMYGAFMFLNSTAGASRISSLKVAFWQIYSTKLRYIEPLAEPVRPSGGLRLQVYHLAKSKRYSEVVIAFTVLSISIRFLYWGTVGTFDDAPDWVRIVDFVFAISYFGEWALRAWVFGLGGVTLVWYDKCDTIVTIVVLIYGFLDVFDMQPGNPVWKTLGHEMHAFLAGCISLRIFRVIRYLRTTHTVLLVVRKSMSTLLAMAALTAAITLAYAIVGVSLFGEYSESFEIDTDASLLTSKFYNAEHSNFREIVPAMQLLYYIGTGADFSGLMQQTTEHVSSNLKWFVPIYLLSYLIVIKYVIYSVCVLVVVYKFTIHATDVNGVAMEAVDDFRRNWQERDPFASGEMPMRDFPSFVRSLKKPLGVDSTSSHLEVDRYIKKALLVMGFAAADIVGPTEDLPYTVKFKKTLVALHYLVIFGDSFGEDKEYFQRRVLARNRILQLKYGIAGHIVKLREQAGGANHESSSGVKDLSVLRLLLPRVFEQRLLKSCLHEMYRLRVQIQFQGYTAAADKEIDLLLRSLREEYESAALQNRRLAIEIDAVVDKFKLEVKQKRNFKYLGLCRQLLRHVTEERERHLMRTWKLETMQLHSKFRVRDPIVKVAVSETGDFLFTASSSKIHAWRMKKASAPASAPLYALSWGAKQSANVLSLACTADAKRFFSGHDDWAIRSWQEDTRGKNRKVKHSGKFALLLQMRGHEGPVYDLLMYDGYLLSCGGDSTVRFWRARSEETLQSTSLASNIDMGVVVPSFGTGIFCISTFKPILDMNKFSEKDVVTQLLAGTSDGQVAAFVLQTDNAFLFTHTWEVSATAAVSEEKDSSLLSTFNPMAAPTGQAVTSVVCPNRFGNSWELCFAGTSSGQIKVFELVWADEASGTKREVSAFKPLWTHNVHASPVSALVPAGGWLWSASHDMSVVAWREPSVQSGGLAQGHEDGYVGHQGKVTAMAATGEMIYSVDDAGILLVRNSREKNEVKFIDGDGARSVAKLSEAAQARMVSDLKQCYVARKTFSLQLEEYTKQAPEEYADLLVPDVWMDTRNSEAFFQPPKFLDAALRDESITHWTFLAQLVRHYFPKREMDKEIPLEVRRWIDSRTALCKKAALKSEANMATSLEALTATQTATSQATPAAHTEANARGDPSMLVNANKHAPDLGPNQTFSVDDGSAALHVDLGGFTVQLPWRLSADKPARWSLEEACKAYYTAKQEGVEANALVPADSMVEVPLDGLMLRDALKPNARVVALFNGSVPRSYKVAKLTIDLPFRKIGAEGTDMRKQWEVQFKKELSDTMGGVKPSRIQIISLESPNVVVNFKIFSEPSNTHAKNPTELMSDLLAAVETGDIKVAGGDVAPGKLSDKTKDVAVGKEVVNTGLMGMVGSWLTATIMGEESENSDEEPETESENESEYSDESAGGDGFDDDLMNPMATSEALSEAANDDDDTSSLALSVADRGRKQKRANKGLQQGSETAGTQPKAGLMDWMGLGGGAAAGGQGNGGVKKRLVSDGGSVASSGTVASGVSHFDEEPFADDEAYDDDEEIGGMNDYDGIEATEMVDLEAMDERMDNLEAWTKQKASEKQNGGKSSSSKMPKDNMKQWVAAKAQSSGRTGGANDFQSLREWLLFDVALDHTATEEIETLLRDAGFESLQALTSPYAVINDKSLKDMGVRRMGHRAQLLTHLDSLRSKVGAGEKPPLASIPHENPTSSLTAEYGLAARLQAMEVEREREREERERQLLEISELKDVVLHALQDPEKRALVQSKAASGGKVGALLSILGGSTESKEEPFDDYEDDDDNDSVYSGSSVANSLALGGSVGSAADDLYALQNATIEEEARSGKELTAGVIFGVELGRTELRGRREGQKWITARVVSYKHPYFSVLYESGETEYLTLGEVQAQLSADAKARSLEAANAMGSDDSDDEDDDDDDSGDE